MTQLLHPVLRQVGLEVPADLPDGELAGISCDSRRVGPGSLFVGLPGTQVVGGCFWPQALRAGALAAVISPAAAAAQRRRRCQGRRGELEIAGTEVGVEIGLGADTSIFAAGASTCGP